MRQAFKWAARISLLIIAVLILIGFAHYSGLQKYKVSVNKNQPASYTLKINHMKSIAKKNENGSICSELKNKNFIIKIQRGSADYKPKNKLIINISHSLAGVTYFNGNIFIPMTKNNKQKTIKLKATALAWHGGKYNGAGLVTTKKCRGYFTLHEIEK